MIVFLILVGLVAGRSDAVSCYTCKYNSTQTEVATCAEPFSAASTPTCSRSVCLYTYQNITGPQSKPALAHIFVLFNSVICALENESVNELLCI